jgi:hypothetical protein
MNASTDPKPIFALSIRQPWAWLIVNGHKDIENRRWRTNFRGPVLIHAAKGMTRAECDGCAQVAAEMGVTLPDIIQLERGGIVGRATVVDCVEQSDSGWFQGPYGFVLRDAKPLPFHALSGELGFFRVFAAQHPLGQWWPINSHPYPGHTFVFGPTGEGKSAFLRGR